MRDETIAIHGGYEPDMATHAVAVPIYQTVASAFDNADHCAALFNLESEGFRHSRIANPTTSVLEKRIAHLEGGVGGLAVATGQAALHFAFVNLADEGGNIVSVPQLYGTTHTLLAHVFPRQGIVDRFAEGDPPDAIEKLIDENTKAVFAETIGNLAGNVCDIESLAKVAHRHGAPLIVDNTVATPILLVALRIERHIENAGIVADFLRHDPRVAWINYAGFLENPYYAHVQKYLDGRAPSLFTFGIKGGHEAGKAFYDALKLIIRLVNFGDAKSHACHPASTTHRQMSPEQQHKGGILPETIRLSIGIEHSADIIEDIDQALAHACSINMHRPAAE